MALNNNNPTTTINFDIDQNGLKMNSYEADRNADGSIKTVDGNPVYKWVNKYADQVNTGSISDKLELTYQGNAEIIKNLQDEMAALLKQDPNTGDQGKTNFTAATIARMQVLNAEIQNRTAAAGLLRKVMEQSAQFAQHR
ncbi:hypothetical protein SAMN06265795_11418 [Noviherbaspirillum humi]|uniref:Uncharacterized protein n=1 Tax=Noviherbaspirillum humi TaxID=1688639 RepID=A0A239JWT9_9BURK|nr:hypothetical protein [Noviherbaspirillum humi]SNT10361.1 hypothetical protein SAMN06265795_11418 [Noviherbaspirillum humi]